MKKSLVFGILLSICMTIPTMADTSNSGIVIESISSLQEQLEEMTEEQKVIAIEKYYSVEDEKIVETRASRQSYLPNIEISDVAEESKNVDGNETFLLYD